MYTYIHTEIDLQLCRNINKYIKYYVNIESSLNFYVKKNTETYLDYRITNHINI